MLIAPAVVLRAEQGALRAAQDFHPLGID